MGGVRRARLRTRPSTERRPRTSRLAVGGIPSGRRVGDSVSKTRAAFRGLMFRRAPTRLESGSWPVYRCSLGLGAGAGGRRRGTCESDSPVAAAAAFRRFRSTPCREAAVRGGHCGLRARAPGDVIGGGPPDGRSGCRMSSAAARVQRQRVPGAAGQTVQRARVQGPRPARWRRGGCCNRGAGWAGAGGPESQKTFPPPAVNAAEHRPPRRDEVRAVSRDQPAARPDPLAASPPAIGHPPRRAARRFVAHHHPASAYDSMELVRAAPPRRQPMPSSLGGLHLSRCRWMISRAVAGVPGRQRAHLGMRPPGWESRCRPALLVGIGSGGSSPCTPFLNRN